MKKVFGLILMALLGIALAAGSTESSDDKAVADIESVQALIDAGDFEAAIIDLETLIAEDDSNPDFYNLLAYSQRNLDDLMAALQNYETALELDPEHLGATEYLGELYLKMGDVALAEAQLEKLATFKACGGTCEEYETLAEAIENFGTTGEASY